MRLLIEGYKYDKEAVEKTLHGIFDLETIEHKIIVNYVGYFYNPSLQDCVFILPKVLLNKEEKVFGRFDPQDIIHLEEVKNLTREERNFIYEFAIWIYRAIAVFNKDEKHRDIVYHKQIPIIGNSKRRLSNTFLDVVLALIKFNKDNQNFFTFMVKNQHSGINKINWTRTIAHSMAYIDEADTPIYLNPVNKKRKINFDEELLVIFYSILNHINEKYGFSTPIRIGYELITGKQFDRYINGYGRRRLREIKYKYFADKTLRLWELCYAFFLETPRVTVEVDQKEYMLVKNFNIVFETMIDALIGDDNIPAGLKDQYDGKIVDHMYTYDDLVDNNKEKVYYIGDSKYYKANSDITNESVYKQFTYARNLIQWNMDVFQIDDDKHQSLRKKQEELGHRKYRDEVTEGYNIIPNFFISAMMKDNLSFTDEEGNIKNTDRKDQFYESSHFSDRLYDRDTLLIFHYDVNFLYIVSLYARDNKSQQNVWKQRVQKIFREKIQTELKKRYKFFAMTARPGVDASAVIRDNFKDLVGRISAPYDDQNIYSLAVPIKDLSDDGKRDSGGLMDMLHQYFDIEGCEPGDNPLDAVTPISFNKLVELEDIVLVGCVKSKKHWEWITTTGKYNIRLEGRTDRPGAKPYTRDMMMVQKVMLYLYNEEDHPTPEYLGIFTLSSPDSIPEPMSLGAIKANTLLSDYPTSNNADNNQQYLLYDINTEKDAEPLLHDVAKEWISQHLAKQEVKGEAYFVRRVEIRV